MSVLGECLGNSVPHEFIHKGKTYKVGLITQAVKAGYEKRLFAKAKEAALTMRELMDKPEYAEHLRQLNNDYIQGEYAFESRRGLAALNTIPGMLSLCSLLFSTDETDVMRLLTERREEVTSLIQLLIKESFPIEEGEPDPNAPRLVTSEE